MGHLSSQFLLNRADKRLYIGIYGNRLEKAYRDLSKLTKKVIIDKNGHKKTVYVKMGLPMKKERKVENTSSTGRANELSFEMFGTPEQVVKMAKTEYAASTREEAKEILRRIVNKPLVSRAGLTATLSNKSMGKILSGKAADKSYSKEAHFLAAANLEHLFSNAIEPFIFPADPSKHNENYRQIRRLMPRWSLKI